jgi:hypothetical protein
MGVGTLGNTYIDTLLAEYVPGDDSLAEEVLTDETDQLLYALLLEMRVSRFNQQGAQDIETALANIRDTTETGAPDQTGTYASVRFDDAGDQRDNLPELQTGDDWQEVELDFVTSEVDLRFGDAIAVAFEEPQQEESVVRYAGDESPVVGVPVQTSTIWLGAQPGSGGATATVEAWHNGGN